MSLSGPFVLRPVGTSLMTLAILLSGALSYGFLPVSPLPQVDFPTISVSASLPGASPETMASAVATPLERQFGRIAGISEMTSTSTLGSTSITLQFDLDRDSDAAARDVQAAINAARSQLPANLPNNPWYRKSNPAESPIMMLSLASTNYSRAQMYDVASTILAQKLSQVKGVGQVYVSGSSTPAVRVEINPTVLNHLGVGLEDVRAALSSANANRPKGQLADADRTWSLSTTDQLMVAAEYEPLMIAYRNGAPIRLKDVASVTDGAEDIRSFGMSNGRPSVNCMVFRQPGENIIETVDRIKSVLPQLEAQIPAAIGLTVTMDRTTTIRASLHDTQFTLLISVALVILVVFVFLRDLRATFIASVAVPVSLVGTFGVMYLAGYSLDNLSLMALTIATGFVVDDAIVVIENISRHLEEGIPPLQAALLGAKEIGFTVLTISVSLVAVFIPVLLMNGILGRLFREFAVVLSVAIVVSLIVSLTTTPMLCALMLKPVGRQRHGLAYRMSEWVFDRVLGAYEWSLALVLRHEWVTLLVTLATIGLTVHLYTIVTTGLFPQQDTGRLTGSVVCDQDASFQQVTRLLQQYAAVVAEDEDVAGLIAFCGGGGGGGGGGSPNQGRMFVTLRPIGERTATADQVIARIRSKATGIPGAALLLQSVQDLRIGGRGSSAQYQYTLSGGNLEHLAEWSPKLLRELRKIPGLVDVNTDQQNKGLQQRLVFDRPTAARLGVSMQTIDDTLYDAGGQRQVSVMYKALNQYKVVMTLDPRFWQSPDALQHLYVRGTGNSQIPLHELYRPEVRSTALAVSHSGLYPSATISFNLTPETALSDVVPGIEKAVRDLGMPEGLSGRFQGSAQAYQEALKNQPFLFLAALVTVYIVLGILYESYIHPITILLTLPSAGVGAILALMICNTELNVLGMIGILLLIGIVKKNAIMMIDCALDLERKEDKPPEKAIFEACLRRFRPITMTTLASLIGGLPLALGKGTGAELRQPLGITIVGGLIFSQLLTLYTTPVVYLFLDRMRLRWNSWRGVTQKLEPLDAVPA